LGTPDESRPGIFRRFFTGLSQIRRDLRAPLPGAAAMSRSRRIAARITLLFKNHGWKLVWGFIIFYLIRDVVLYIIIPYLIATEMFG
jgi:hypothetical protein